MLQLPRGDLSAAVTAWARSVYPEQPHLYFGRSGGTLLLDVLRQEERPTVVLPAFICPALSAVAARAGKRILHLDVDRDTLHIPLERLEACLEDQDAGGTILLVDHTFGYPFAGLAGLRRRHPGLLIVEDCVRALGAEIDGQPVGRVGDWCLLSLHKTAVGINHGALLLTRSPYAIRPGPPPRVSPQQWTAGFAPARALYEAYRRRRGPLPEPGPPGPEPEWSEAIGVPNRLALSRFVRDVCGAGPQAGRQARASKELREALAGIEDLRLVGAAPGARPAAHFLSFTVAGDGTRDELWRALYLRGFFLDRDWSPLPSSFTAYSETFPCGAAESEFLSAHIMHVPVNLFLRSGRPEALAAAIRASLEGIPRR